jgi:glycerate 2-kinase
VAAAELIVTGEGRFDDQTLHGKVGQRAGFGSAGPRHPGAGSVRRAIDDAANQLTGLAGRRPPNFGNSGQTRYR